MTRRRSSRRTYSRSEDDGGSYSDASSSLADHHSSSSSSKKDLQPISSYINDRPEMIEQVFSVIRGAKLRAMLTSTLRDVGMSELKRLCLEELEGMSKKRIKCILKGRGGPHRSFS